MNGLRFREWFVVYCVGGFLLSLFLMETFSSAEHFPSLPHAKEVKVRTIQVKVTGAVENPGEYEVYAGTSLQEVLKRAKLQQRADRRALYLKKRLFQSCELKVPQKKNRESGKKREKKYDLE